MSDHDGWFIHLTSEDGQTKGPYDTPAMEDFASRGMIVAESRVSHPRHTKGREVEARRIARFFNIFASVSDQTALSIPADHRKVAPLNLGKTERNDEVQGIGRFMADGQDPAMICKLAERVDGICTRDESVLYMAVQQRPLVNFSPDAVVLTNRRAIVFRQKILGQLEFVDVPWLDISDIHLEENVLGSTIFIRGMNTHVERISHLPKSQARRVYRIGQEIEQKMIETRRERAMEEKRAGALQLTVNNDLGHLTKSTISDASSDPVIALRSLRQMFDAGLIDEAEFKSKKSQIVDRL